MKTFEYKDGKSAKFWSIALDGKVIEVQFGKLGTKGRSQIRKLPSEEKALAEYEKRIKEKCANGYIETTPGTTAGARHALEKALVENPRDLATHSAYADFLHEQGDERGDLIQVQLALEDPECKGKERKKLKAREAKLMKKLRPDLLGILEPFLSEPPSDHEYQWKISRGWLDYLYIGSLSVEFAEALARSPQARLLRELFIYYWDYEEGITEDMIRKYRIPEKQVEDMPGLYPLIRSPNLAALRVLRLGEDDGDEYRIYPSDYRFYYKSRCHVIGRHITDFVKALPDLEELYLFADSVDARKLFSMPLAKLRILQLNHLWKYPLEVLARNPAMANLTHLLIHPKSAGSWSSDLPYIKMKSIKALLHSRHLKSLTHLRLRLTDMGDRGCQEIVDSGILKRLKSLDLRHGCITDEGAAILAACPDIGHLEHLDLMRNQMTEAGVKQLKKVVPVVADHQQGREEIEDDSWGHPVYLYEGDYE